MLKGPLEHFRNCKTVEKMFTGNYKTKFWSKLKSSSKRKKTCTWLRCIFSEEELEEHQTALRNKFENAILLRVYQELRGKLKLFDNKRSKNGCNHKTVTQCRLPYHMIHECIFLFQYYLLLSIAGVWNGQQEFRTSSHMPSFCALLW